MEKQYYTPSLDEFYVGFEVEWSEYGRKIWIEETIDEDDLSDLCLGIDKVSHFKVKYLDREDIESCNWDFVEQGNSPNSVMVFIQKEPFADKGTEYEQYWHIWLYNNHNVVIHNNQNYSSEVIIFNGTIKNKSELKRVMNMLNIK